MTRESVQEYIEVFALVGFVLPCPFLSWLMKGSSKNKQKKTPTTVPGHCLTGLLEVLGLPMFTNLKLSCHWRPWWTALLRDRHRENTKAFFSQRVEGGLMSGRSMGGGGRGGMHPVVRDHCVRLTFLIHRPTITWAAWIYKLEHTCSTITTSDLQPSDLSLLPKFRVRSCCSWFIFYSLTNSLYYMQENEDTLCVL